MLNILLLSGDPTLTALLRASAVVLDGTLEPCRGVTDLSAKLGSATPNVPLAVVLDLQTVAVAPGRVASACALIRKARPDAKIGLVASATHWIDESAEGWAKLQGADVIVPQVNAERWQRSGEQLLSGLLGDRIAAQAVSNRPAPPPGAAAQSGGNIQAQLIAAAEARTIDLAALAIRMRDAGGVAIGDHSYRLTTYPECFIASDGVTWLANALSVPRDIAVAVGQALQAAGLIYHVARAQTFVDDNFYFRVARVPQRWDVEDFYSLIRRPSGFRVADRPYLGNSYSDCFVGSEAVAWMLDHGYSVNEALSMGQRLLDLSLVHHVVNEHPFKNEELYYRFFRD